MAKVRFECLIWSVAASLLVIAAGTAYAQSTVRAVRPGGGASGHRPAQAGHARRNAHVTLPDFNLDPSLLCSNTELCVGVCREACNLQVFIQQATILEEGLPAGVSIPTAAAKMFTSDAALIVTPMVAFPNGLVAFEYVVTFSRPPGLHVPPPVVTLTGSEVHDIVVSGSTLTAVFDLLLASPYNASKTVSLRGWTMISFNEASLVTHQTIIYPLWEEVITTLGFDEAYTDSTVVATIADQVCTAHQYFCTGANQQYASKASCMAFMLALPPPPVHRMAGNNLFCRFFHARYLDLFPDVHCPHVGPTGGAQCTEDLPYSMAKLNALLPRPTFYSVNPLLQAEINKTAHF